MIDYTNQKFGKLTVIAEAERVVLPSGQKPRRLLCLCDCGKTHTALALHLKRGRIISCGCVFKTQDGDSVNQKVYKVWAGIKARVAPSGIDRHRYYDRGIAMCEEWKDYKVFKKWALSNGYKEGLTIDRIDNSKGYSPQNCRFVSVIENVNNRDCSIRVTYNGEVVSLMVLLDKLGKRDSRALVVNRLKRGWDVKKAIWTPARQGNYKRKAA